MFTVAAVRTLVDAPCHSGAANLQTTLQPSSSFLPSLLTDFSLLGFPALDIFRYYACHTYISGM